MLYAVLLPLDDPTDRLFSRSLTIGILLARTTALPAWILLMFGGIGLLQGVIAAEFRALDGDELGRAQAQIATRILSYLLALALFLTVVAKGMHADDAVGVPGAAA